MITQPNSKLTSERPDIWNEAISLATSLTSIKYVHKELLPDNSISACGGGIYYPSKPTQHEITIKKIDDIDRQINNRKGQIERYEKSEHYDSEFYNYKENIEGLKRQREQAH